MQDRKDIHYSWLRSDPVPGIDYNLRAIFSLQDRGLDILSNAKQEEIVQIFQRMSLVQAQLSPSNNVNGEIQEGFASWYKNDTNLMESCRAGT